MCTGGAFHLWMGYNIPMEVTELEESNRAGMSDVRFAQAVNDFGKVGYGGPCPPNGHRLHACHFRLSALGERIDGGTTKSKSARHPRSALLRSLDPTGDSHPGTRTCSRKDCHEGLECHSHGL